MMILHFSHIALFIFTSLLLCHVPLVLCLRLPALRQTTPAQEGSQITTAQTIMALNNGEQIIVAKVGETALLENWAICVPYVDVLHRIVDACGLHLQSFKRRHIFLLVELEATNISLGPRNVAAEVGCALFDEEGNGFDYLLANTVTPCYLWGLIGPGQKVKAAIPYQVPNPLPKRLRVEVSVEPDGGPTIKAYFPVNY